MRHVRWLWFVVVVSLVCAAPARAQEWGRGWLERLSGPGPFRGIEIGMPVGCLWERRTNDIEFVPVWDSPSNSRENDESRRLACFDGQFSSLSNKDRDEIGLIEVRHVEGSLSLPLEFTGNWYWLAAIEPTIGTGAIRFQGTGFQEWRFSLSTRVVLKPLKLIPVGTTNIDRKRAHRFGDWRGVLQFSYGAVYIAPHITNEDLLVRTGETFSHGWLGRGTHIAIDVSELLGFR
jgi:hypothetical protein